MNDVNPRRPFPMIAGAPVLDLPSRGVRCSRETLVISIGRNMMLLVSANVRVRSDGMSWRAFLHLVDISRR